MAEHHFRKVGVVGSTPTVGSKVVLVPPWGIDNSPDGGRRTPTVGSIQLGKYAQEYILGIDFRMAANLSLTALAERLKAVSDRL